MAILTPSVTGYSGVNHTFTAASTGGDSFTNDGKTVVLFANTNASSRTLTIAANTITKQGIGAVAIPSTTISLPNSTTNGGVCMAGPFPVDRFNDSNGRVNLSYDAVTGLTVAVVKITQYA
jgi:hypothetical protein